MKLKPNLYRRVLSGGIGPGGWGCACCAPAPGKVRKAYVRAKKKEFGRLLTRFIIEELEAGDKL